MATYVNDLRLKEIATGDESGTWGTSTNTNLELIAEAFSFGTEAITTNADTHTTTIADGSTDPGRSIFLKYTGTLDSACTITIGPNTVSKLWLIENATSGSQNIIIKQGSGATVTIANGQTKAIYSDGAGSGGAMVDAFQDLSIPDLFIDDDLTFTSDSAVITFGADGDTTLTHTDGSGLTLNSTNKLMFNDASQFIQGSSATVLSLGATDEIDLTATLIDINGNADVSGTVTATGTSVFASLDISGDIDVDGTTNLDVVDIDGAVDMASTLAVGGVVTANAGVVVDNITIDGTEIDLSSGDLTLDVAGNIILNADGAIWKFEDASVEIFRINSGSQNANLVSMVQDKDLRLQGYDGSSLITALTLDMSEAGAATFNAGAIFNESGADSDFRVESDNFTHMLFVDAGNDHINIGGSADSGGMLNVAGDINLVVGSGNPAFTIKTAGTGNNPSIAYRAGDNVVFDNMLVASASTDYWRVGYGSSGSVTDEILAVTSAGKVGINITTIDAEADALQVVSSGTNTVLIDGTGSHELYSYHDSAGVGWATGPDGSFGELLYLDEGSSRIVMYAGGNSTTFFTDAATVVNDDSRDHDFRVESNADANAFFVNGGDGVVSFGGMGTNTRSPSAVQPKFQANSLTRMDSSISLCCNSNDALASLIMFSKTRSGNLTGATAAQAGDAVGGITWNAADGTDIEHGIAAIDAVVESGIGTNDTPGALRFYTNSGTTAASERVRINGTGDLQVATTDTTLFSNTSGGGINLMASNRFDVARTGDVVQTLNRMSSDGSILQFYMRGARCGDIVGIGTDGMAFAAPSDGGAAILVTGNANIIYPARNSSGTIAASDNSIDLGASGVRFNDAFITNGVTTGSDRNLKQDIEELSDAEKRVAVACKSLLRKWRWKDAVEEKGDDARIHIGIIAQDLQDAFTAEGLDAARYGMFCSDTWWEAKTEVAAKEATETSPAIEAHTRTDRFDTAEEAPEGAVQCTRLSVRYSELLAFIISAI
jgi:cytoskeletal protein CcmA (bactofilin family)